jgi:hypothetical protein
MATLLSRPIDKRRGALVLARDDSVKRHGVTDISLLVTLACRGVCLCAGDRLSARRHPRAAESPLPPAAVQTTIASRAPGARARHPAAVSATARLGGMSRILGRTPADQPSPNTACAPATLARQVTLGGPLRARSNEKLREDDWRGRAFADSRLPVEGAPYSQHHESSSCRSRGRHRGHHRAEGHRRGQRARTRLRPGHHRTRRRVRGRPDSRRAARAPQARSQARRAAAQVNSLLTKPRRWRPETNAERTPRTGGGVLRIRSPRTEERAQNNRLRANRRARARPQPIPAERCVCTATSPWSASSPLRRRGSHSRC